VPSQITRRNCLTFSTLLEQSPTSGRELTEIISRGSQVPRLSCYINVLGVVFKTNKFAVWPHVSVISSCSHFVSWLLMEHSECCRGKCSICQKRSSLLRREARGSGAVGLHSVGFPGLCDITVYLRLEFSCAPLNVFSFAWPVNRVLSLLLLSHIVHYWIRLA
jgi:hypothetical protein